MCENIKNLFTTERCIDTGDLNIVIVLFKKLGLTRRRGHLKNLKEFGRCTRHTCQSLTYVQIYCSGASQYFSLEKYFKQDVLQNIYFDLLMVQCQVVSVVISVGKKRR